MANSDLASRLLEEETPSRTPWAVWTAILSLAILLHLLLLILNPHWNTPAPPKPVEIHQIDPKKLAAIRNQWQREKALLLNKDKNAPKDAEAPKDARYVSDRNIRVEKEQVARQTNVIPKAGTRAQPESQPQTKKQPPPKLGQLGVPLNLERQSRPIPNGPKRNRSEEGGDQALRDRKLPQGSENLLNAQESIYYSFYARLYEAIGPIWQSYIRQVPFMRRVPAGEYSTVVDVVFDRQGNLVDIKQVQASGIAEFDRAVPQSWKKIGSFPNPPAGLLNEVGEVHTGWTFTVNVGESTGVEYLPPERVY